MSFMTENAPDPKRTLTEPELVGEQLPDWRMLIDRLHASFDTGDFVTAVKLVNAIALAAEEMDHHPDLDLAYGQLDVRLTSHDVGGVTSRDVALALTISALALAAGATPLMVRASGEFQIRDATGRRASIWFQPTEAHQVPRQGWHLDLRIPPEVVEDRIAAAIEAGGALVDDTAAPAFWVLADPQGNRACLTTWQGRESQPILHSAGSRTPGGEG